MSVTKRGRSLERHEGNIFSKFRLDLSNSLRGVFTTKKQMKKKSRGHEQKQYVLSTSELVGPYIMN